MKKIKITWDDLRDIPAEDYMEGRVAVTGLAGGDVPVTGADLGSARPYLTVGLRDSILHKTTFGVLGLGLVREVEENPHGLVPEDPWTHIVLGDGRHFVRGDQADTHPWLASCDGSYDWWPHPSVQALADEHGFEVLVPEVRVSEAREKARLAGIREVYDACKSQAGFPWASTARAQIERAFPEAFRKEA